MTSHFGFLIDRRTLINLFGFLPKEKNKVVNTS